MKYTTEILSHLSVVILGQVLKVLISGEKYLNICYGKAAAPDVRHEMNGEVQCQ